MGVLMVETVDGSTIASVEKKSIKKLHFGIVLSLIILLFLASILNSMNSTKDPISITVFPEVPKEGLPILVIFNLNNPALRVDMVQYELYANGILLTHGTTQLL